MPDDLDDLASQAEFQDRWKTPRWDSSLTDLANRQSMTHQDLQPNTAAPYLQGARDIAAGVGRFSHGALTETFPDIKKYMPTPIQKTGEVFQSRAARDALSTANIGGLTLPLVESILTREGLPLFHGTPEAFERFDYGKVGTGAGTAYGHGIYLAEHPDVAKSYKPPGGYMYEAGLRGDPTHFIDFNLPFSRQTQHVQSVLDSVGLGAIPDSMHMLTAMRMAMGDDKVISDSFLAHGGIKGFKYLDQFSRRRGHGTRNYVVIDDRLIDIWKRWGPMAVAAIISKGYYDFQRDEGPDQQ